MKIGSILIVVAGKYIEFDAFLLIFSYLIFSWKYYSEYFHFDSLSFFFTRKNYRAFIVDLKKKKLSFGPYIESVTQVLNPSNPRKIIIHFLVGLALPQIPKYYLSYYLSVKDGVPIFWYLAGFGLEPAKYYWSGLPFRNIFGSKKYFLCYLWWHGIYS